MNASHETQYSPSYRLRYRSAAQARLTDRALLDAYGGGAEPDVHVLMRFMSDFREAMWGVVQQGLSELDFDFEAPGLHRYFRPFLEDAELSNTPGLIDFFVNFVEASHIAGDGATALQSFTLRQAPPSPGMMPSLRKVTPKRALSAATTMSQARAISNPPPAATPLTAAISGLGQS